MKNKMMFLLSIQLMPFICEKYIYEDLLKSLYQQKKTKLSDGNSDIYKYVNYKTNIVNLDNLNLTLEKKFGSFRQVMAREDLSAENQYYFNLIDQLTSSLISSLDGKIVFKYWQTESDLDVLGPFREEEKIEIFTVINSIFTLDLLAVNFIAMQEESRDISLTGFFSCINLADKQLSSVLFKGVADNHLHAGTAFNFSIAFSHLVNIFWYKNSYFQDYFEKVVKKISDKNFIYTAIIIRLFLAVFLRERIKNDLKDFLNKSRLDIETKDLINQLLIKNVNIEDYVNERKILENEEYKGIFEHVWDDIKNKYDVSNSEEDMDFLDGIFLSEVKTYSENIFLFRSLKYRNANQGDVAFDNMFLKYIRIKNHIYSILVEGRYEIKGLNQFQNYFDASSQSINAINQERYNKLFFDTVFQDGNLKKLEIRISIKDNFRKKVGGLLRAYKSKIDVDYSKGKKSFPRFSIVTHFIKKDDKDKESKCYVLNQKRDNIEHLYFGEIQSEYLYQLDTLNDLRNDVKGISEFLVGIDAASDENITPVSVFAPVFNNARGNGSRDLYENLDCTNDTIRKKDLSFSFHAGEDFRHIYSGLRRIDEVVEHCKFHSGDRIGHGTALYINTNDWIRENYYCILPRGEMLDNYLWIWGILSDSSIDPEINIFLERQIYKIFRDIYSNTNGFSIQILYDAYFRRFAEFRMTEKLCKYDELSGCKLYDEREIWDVKKLVYAYHCNCFYKSIHVPEEYIITEMDVKLINIAQKIVEDRISKKGIILEKNPSSNITITELNTFCKAYENVENREYSYCINTDNPSVFNTTISNELAILYYSMQRHFGNRKKALAYIDTVRQEGLNASFSDDQYSDEEYYKILESVVKCLE